MPGRRRKDRRRELDVTPATTTELGGPNLVPNGDFSDGLTGWTAWECTLAPDDAEFVEAPPSCKASTTGAWGGPWQEVPVPSGALIRMAVQIKAPLGYGFGLQLTYHTDAGAYAGEVWVEAVGTGEWQTVGADTSVPATATSGELGVYMREAGTDYNLDDFVLGLAPGILSITRDPAREAALVQLAVPPGATRYTLTRTGPSGDTAAVRGCVLAPTEGAASLAVRDFEVPFDVPLLYEVTYYDDAHAVVGSDSANFQLDYHECRAWLVDLARPTNSLPLVIETFSPLDFEVPAGVHRVLDRRAPVLVTLPAWTPEAELNVLTDTLAERDALRNLLGAGYPMLLRTDPEQGIGNMYLGVTGFSEDRLLALGDAEPRRFSISVVQVARPNPAVFTPKPANTYQVVADTYASYADLLAEVHTYDALAWIFPEGVSAGYVPWLPADV